MQMMNNPSIFNKGPMVAFCMLSFLNNLSVSAHNVIDPPADLDAPGEMGRPVILPTNMTTETKKLVDEGWLNNAFNQYASDLISVHRSLPDPRDEWWVCLY